MGQVGIIGLAADGSPAGAPAEGSFTLSGTIADVSGDTLNARIEFGDGSVLSERRKRALKKLQ